MTKPGDWMAETARRMEEMRNGLVRGICARLAEDGVQATAIPGLSLYRRSERTACTSAAYEPSLIVFVQGEKRIQLGQAALVCDESTFLLTSIDLPVVSQVTRATREKPILGMILKLGIPEVRRILSEDEFAPAAEADGRRGMSVGRMTPELLGALARLADLLESPRDAGFLSGLVRREIIYRVLRSPQGGHLRAIATLGEQTHRTAKAVAWLRSNYAKPLRVEDLAEIAQMGVSTLHHHFRALTAMSPVQYQKQLRLHVARERMLLEGMDAATAAFAVGYESPSQFSREYARFFGQPPMRDVKAQLLAGVAANQE